MIKYFTIIFTTIVFVLFASCDYNINSSEELFDKINSTYHNKWYKNISFSQTTSYYAEDSVSTPDRWFEEYQYPGKLAVRSANHDNYAFLYVNDSVYEYKNNNLLRAENYSHELLFFSKDIYNTPRDEIDEKFNELGYDINKFYKTKYNNRHVYVIGAESSNNISNQVWYDAEHFYLCKLIKNSDDGLKEISLHDFIEVSGQGWIEQELVYSINGEIFLKEKYFDINMHNNPNHSFRASDFSSDKAYSFMPKITDYIDYKHFVVSYNKLLDYMIVYISNF